MNAGILHAYALIAAAGVLWGTTFPLARIGTTAGATPLGFIFWQAAIGGALLLAVGAATGRRPGLGRADLKRYVVLGILGTALPGTLFFWAAPHAPSGVLAITVATVPLLTYGASCALGLDRASARRLAGLALGLGAIAVMVLPESSLPDRSMAPWVLLTLLAAVCYAVENLMVALRVPAGTDMLALLCGMLLVSAVMVAPLALATGQFFGLSWPWSTVEYCALAMAVASSGAYVMFLQTIHLAGPVFASQAGYVVTVSGVLWGMLLLGERHSAWVWAAFVLVLAGLAMVTPSGGRARQA